jgi:hypothetical protein
MYKFTFRREVFQWGKPTGKGTLIISYKNGHKDDEFEGITEVVYYSVVSLVDCKVTRILIAHAHGTTTINNTGNRIHSVSFLPDK